MTGSATVTPKKTGLPMPGMTGRTRFQNSAVSAISEARRGTEPQPSNPIFRPSRKW